MTEPALTHTSAVELIRASIEQIAPDVDAATIPCDADLRIEAELDSMDFLAVLSTVKERIGVDVPESDVSATHTIDGFADYLVGRMDGDNAQPPRHPDQSIGPIGPTPTTRKGPSSNHE